MTRYKLTLEYDGSGFVGWQRQLNGLSLQEVLETAVFRFCGERVTSHVAGRTDAGVHALGQVAHIDLARAPAPAPEVVRDAVNFHMKPHAVAVLAAEVVGEDFHARFSARERALSLPHRQPPRAARTRGAGAPGSCRRRSISRRCGVLPRS